MWLWKKLSCVFTVFFFFWSNTIYIYTVGYAKYFWKEKMENCLIPYLPKLCIKKNHCCSSWRMILVLNNPRKLICYKKKKEIYLIHDSVYGLEYLISVHLLSSFAFEMPILKVVNIPTTRRTIAWCMAQIKSTPRRNIDVSTTCWYVSYNR